MRNAVARERSNNAKLVISEVNQGAMIGIRIDAVESNETMATVSIEIKINCIIAK